MDVLVLVSYVLCIGVVVHEVAHRIFCGIFGVRVRETRYFKVERKKTKWGEQTTIGGYLNIEDIDSVIVGIFLGIAPLIVNGVSVALIYYFSPLLGETPIFWLLVYLGIALGIGARPSKEDLKLCIGALKRAPGRGIIEILLAFVFCISICVLVVLQINIWVTLSVTLSFLILLVIQGRSRTRTTRVRYFPNT